MSLPNTAAELDEKFFTNLNEDIKLKPNEYGEWDMVFEDKDIKNVTGLESLANAIVILIMTRYDELKNNLLYKNDFGCRVHEIIKDNMTQLNIFKIEKYIEESIRRMRRVKKINYIDVKPFENGYKVLLSVTALNDEDLTLQFSFDTN